MKQYRFMYKMCKIYIWATILNKQAFMTEVWFDASPCLCLHFIGVTCRSAES